MGEVKALCVSMSKLDITITITNDEAKLPRVKQISINHLIRVNYLSILSRENGFIVKLWFHEEVICSWVAKAVGTRCVKKFNLKISCYFFFFKYIVA